MAQRAKHMGASLRFVFCKIKKAREAEAPNVADKDYKCNFAQATADILLISKNVYSAKNLLLASQDIESSERCKCGSSQEERNKENKK